MHTEEASLQESEVTTALEPFLAKLYHGEYDRGIYTGAVIMQIIDWYNSPDYGVDSMIRKCLDRNPGSFSDTDVARARHILQEFKVCGYDLSLYQEARHVVHPRQDKGLRRRRWIEEILLGKIRKLDDLSFPWLSNDKKELQKKTMAQLAFKKEQATLAAGNIQRALDKDKAAPPLRYKRTVVTETHGVESLGTSIDHLQATLSGVEDKLMVGITYSPQKNIITSTDSTRLGIEDRDGHIPQESLRQYLHGQSEVIFVMTGGNLRGCMGSTFNSLLASCQAESVCFADFHFPLDCIYDNMAYNEPLATLRFIPNVLKRDSSLSHRTFRNGSMTDATEGYGNKRFRLYFWDTAQMMVTRC